MADGIDPAAAARVQARLAAIESRHAVRILFAIESGSRAWGFPSPDSDYDCRFVFIRSAESYLSLWRSRDVIELPLDGDLDVNGWDVGKTIRLLGKGNAVAIEWLTSPIVYREEKGAREMLLALARRISTRERVGRHYLHLGEEQYRRFLADQDEVSLKKVFYALRPAAALRWLRLRPGYAVAPMGLTALLQGCDAPGEVTTPIDDLIVRKRSARELGTAPLPEAIRAFILQEYTIARTTFARVNRDLDPGQKADADAVFR